MGTMQKLICNRFLLDLSEEFNTKTNILVLHFFFHNLEQGFSRCCVSKVARKINWVQILQCYTVAGTHSYWCSPVNSLKSTLEIQLLDMKVFTNTQNWQYYQYWHQTRNVKTKHSTIKCYHSEY